MDYEYIVIFRASNTDITGLIELGLLDFTKTRAIVKQETLKEFDQFILHVRSPEYEQRTLADLFQRGKIVWYHLVNRPRIDVAADGQVTLYASIT